MPITLGQNISSLKAQSQLNRGADELSTVYQRLSSGMRINAAADDAAGLAIASSLNAGARIFTQAIRNVNDGVSLLNIADSALDSLTDIVTRIGELATQAANGTLSKQQRQAADAEAQALSKEYQRIARSTTFNNMAIFDGSFGRLNLQVGTGSNGIIGSGLGGAIGTGALGSISSSLAEGSGTFHGYKVTLADLNSDGILDLVSAGDTDSATGYVNVRLGTGGGTFGAAVSFANEGEITWAISVNDVNNDGVLDLVTAGDGGAAGSATIRLGRGDGTFGAAVSYTTESASSYGVVLGDLNDDGKLDLVTTGQGGGGVTSIRFGNGDGTFGASTTFVAETGISRQVQLTDLNGDGRLDIVTLGRDPTTTGYLTARLGLGGGTFGAATSYVVASTGGGSFTWGMAMADFNGDGRADFVGGATNSAVLLSVGDGTFTVASTIAPGVGGSPTDITAADLNGDGNQDLIVAQTTPGTIVYLGNGNGTFGGPTIYSEGITQTRSVAVGDLNADGVVDVVAIGLNASSDAQVNVRLTTTVDGVAPLLPFSLNTTVDARSAMTLASQKLTQLASQRSQIGAFESRLDFAGRVLNSQEMSYREAAGRILDADVAEESARLVAIQIRTQAAAAVLAQANTSASMVLKLLGG